MSKSLTKPAVAAKLEDVPSSVTERLAAAVTADGVARILDVRVKHCADGYDIIVDYERADDRKRRATTRVEE